MIEIRSLEIHASHACNLACESCTHFSNHKHSGNLSVDDAKEWLAAWSQRIIPRQFAILGGEPALNSKLTEVVYLSRDYWPNSSIILVTNGFLLNRHLYLPVALKACNVTLHISEHHQGNEYQAKLKPVRALVADWQRRWGVTVHWRASSSSWQRVFRDDGLPFTDGRPYESWSHCRSKWCMQLHDGKLWKCPPLAYLPRQAAKYGYGPEWRPYLSYEPLHPGCTDEQLAEFVGRQCEAVCGMCPANPETFELPNPLRGRS